MERLAAEEQIFKLKLKYYGYDSEGTHIFYNQRIASIVEILNDIPANKDFTTDFETLDHIKKNSERFMRSHFSIHSVDYIDAKKMEDIFKKTSFKSVDEILQLLKRLKVKVNPFALPIHRVAGHSMVGDIKKPLPLINDDYYLTNAPISFSHIDLGRNLTTISRCTIAHEITHSQIESVKGSVREYTNKEVLSVLMEKIFALEIDNSGKILSKVELCRFRHLLDIISAVKSNINVMAKVSSLVPYWDHAIYIPSILQAERLFDIYQYGSTEVRDEMIKNIQKVFDGQITLEQLLDFYNVNYENSQDTDLVRRHLSL